jgi:hypothetical protein
MLNEWDYARAIDAAMRLKDAPADTRGYEQLMIEAVEEYETRQGWQISDISESRQRLPDTGSTLDWRHLKRALSRAGHLVPKRR